MVAHLLVDVEVGGRRRVKTSQQLVHHDQQFHLTRLVDEFLLHRQFKLVRLGLRRLWWLAKPVRQHLPVHPVLEQVVGITRARGLALGIRHVGRIATHNSAFTLQLGFAEQLVVLAGFINTARHQHGVAVAVHQARFGSHVQHDVRHDLLQARLAGQHPLHGAPLLLKLGFGQVIQPAGLGIKPLVNLLL